MDCVSFCKLETDFCESCGGSDSGSGVAVTLELEGEKAKPQRVKSLSHAIEAAPRATATFC